MTGCVEAHDGHAADHDELFIFNPILRERHGHIRHTEHPALRFQIRPEIKIILVQTQRCAGQPLHFAGGEKVIEVGVRV
jgi:hypothetical protein